MKERSRTTSEELLQLIRHEWAPPGESIQPDMSLKSLNTWNSLNALLLWALIQKHFGVELPMTLFYQEVTIEDIARYIQANQDKN